MSLFKFKCGHCTYGFQAADTIPGEHEQTCPRCNWGTYWWQQTEWDKASGRWYKYFVTDTLFRAGRERQQLRSDDLIHKDGDEVEDGRTYIARF